MKRQHFAIIALTLAVPLLGLLWVGGEPRTAAPEAGPLLPWLTLLIVSEFGLILSAVGALLGVQHGRQQGWSGRDALITLGCALAAVAFLLQLIRWWPL
jgi:hypothetical protein